MGSDIKAEIEKLIKKISKKEPDEKVEKISTIKVLRKVDGKSMSNLPRIDVRYKVYPSSFGIGSVNGEPKESEENGQIFEGVVPIISYEPRLADLARQLEEHSKLSRIEKYKRIHRQSMLLSKFRDSGLKNGEIERVMNIMPEEYDIHIHMEASNFIADSQFSKPIIIHANNFFDLQEFDEQLTKYGEDALHELLRNRISEESG